MLTCLNKIVRTNFWLEYNSSNQ